MDKSIIILRSFNLLPKLFWTEQRAADQRGVALLKILIPSPQLLFRHNSALTLMKFYEQKKAFGDFSSRSFHLRQHSGCPVILEEVAGSMCNLRGNLQELCGHWKDGTFEHQRYGPKGQPCFYTLCYRENYWSEIRKKLVSSIIKQHLNNILVYAACVIYYLLNWNKPNPHLRSALWSGLFLTAGETRAQVHINSLTWITPELKKGQGACTTVNFTIVCSCNCWISLI